MFIWVSKQLNIVKECSKVGETIYFSITFEKFKEFGNVGREVIGSICNRTRSRKRFSNITFFDYNKVELELTDLGNVGRLYSFTK
ncbi:2813_t:CDS:2, partial [Funneliformis mosseae]